MPRACRARPGDARDRMRRRPTARRRNGPPRNTRSRALSCNTPTTSWRGHPTGVLPFGAAEWRALERARAAADRPGDRRDGPLACTGKIATCPRRTARIAMRGSATRPPQGRRDREELMRSFEKRRGRGWGTAVVVAALALPWCTGCPQMAITTAATTAASALVDDRSMAQQGADLDLKARIE